jgi:hypothetical protein
VSRRMHHCTTTECESIIKFVYGFFCLLELCVHVMARGMLAFFCKIRVLSARACC